MDAMLDESNMSVGAAVKSPMLSDPDKITKQVVRGINRAGTPAKNLDASQTSLRKRLRVLLLG
jgi:hypothetical protein